MADLVHWLEAHLAPCFYMKFLGVECPGCGMQRSLIALLKGDLLESFKLYPALLPLIFMLVFLVLHLLFKFEKGAKYLVYNFILVALLNILGYLF